ncbi:MAG: alcohol dehydrogenase catalytic domain-containing protein, partial [Candidatus Paceibacterota bacterium]
MPDSMLAVVKEKPKKGISIKHIPIPKPKKGEVLIRVLYASICGTDIGIYDWTPWAAGHIKPPIVIGHEVVGRVIRVIPDPDQESNHMDSRFRENDIKVGDIVSSETHIFCGKCYQCKIGNHNICENMQLFGIGRNGGFAEYATIPLRTTWKNPSTGSGQARSIPIKAMSVQEPLGNAVHVVTKANIKGKRVLIVGLGPTGLCAGMAARALGAKEIVGLNRTNYRRKLAKNIGFDKVLPRLPKKYFDAFDAVFE